VLGLAGPSGAWAQCSDDFNYSFIAPPPYLSATVAFPLGVGSSLSALTSTINTVNTAFLTSTSAFVSSPGNPAPDQQGSGAWGRVIGGTVDLSTTSTGTLKEPPSRPVVATGTQTCNTKVSQDYVGYQVGHDISILNGGGSGANWHFGATAGYLEARTKDKTPAGTYVNPIFGTGFSPAGSLSQDAQVPFAGLYTAFTKGNFAFDAQARWDFYQTELTDPINGLSGQRFDARGFSLTANTSYNISLGNNWFIEPSAGVVWSRVNVDDLNVAGGVLTIPGFGAFPVGTGTVTVDEIQSILGRASVSFGTSFTSHGVIWQPYFTASVFHEFDGDVTARSISALYDPGDPFVLTVTSKGGVGTYGQFALGTAAVLGNTGWLGYLRGDYRIGEDIEGWSINGGLRYQFSPGPGRASIKDGPVPAAYSYNWTGPYIGGYFGSMWGDEHWRYVGGGGTAEPDFAGYIAGGQAGYNVQFGRVVVGIEADYGHSNAKGGVSCPNAFDYTCEAEADRVASVTGRLGYTWGRALFYGKGGWAGADVTVQTKRNDLSPIPPSGTPVNGTSEWVSGWTIGGGVEFALTDRWSAKAEYMHYDFGKDRYTVDFGLPVDATTRADVARIGLNLHFNPVQRELPLK
jgi:opacity protein-like surface antigen